MYDKADGVYGVYRFAGVSKYGNSAGSTIFVEIDKSSVDFYNDGDMSNWKMSRIKSNGDVYVGNNLNVDKDIELYGNLKVSPMVVASEERGNIEAQGTITAEGGFIGNLTGVASKADNAINNLENNSYSPLKWNSNNSFISEGISSSLYTEIGTIYPKDTYKVHLDAWVNLWKSEKTVGEEVAVNGYTTIDLPEIANTGIYQFEVVFSYDNGSNYMDSLIKLPLEGESYYNKTVIRQRFAFGPGNDTTNTYVAIPLSTLTNWANDGDNQGGSSALLVSRKYEPGVGLTQLYFQYVERLNGSNPGHNDTVSLYAINLLV